MTKIFLTITIFLLCLTVSARTFAAKNLDAELDAIIGNEGTKVPGLGVVVFKDGKRIYEHFGGHRHISPDKQMTRKTLLRVASVSKMFTVFTIMQLAEQGKLNLSDDASDYLGFELRNPNYPDVPITIEMLASHTSSIRDGKTYLLPPNVPLNEFFIDDEHFAPENEPPKKFFRYSNLNFGILATIIERVTGERFDLYQKNNILKQLEIGGGYIVGNFDEKTFANIGTLYQKNSATVDDYKIQPKKDFITVQNADAPEVRYTFDVSDYKVGTNATIFGAQGGLRLSFDNLSNALEMLINRGTFRGKKILDEKSFDEMFRSHWVFDENNPNGDTLGGVMENYGLATYKIVGKSPARLCKDFDIDLVGHSGEALGMISGIYFRPNTRDGVIFMINGTSIDVSDKEAAGQFGTGFIWEENIINPVCKEFFAN